MIRVFGLALFYVLALVGIAHAAPKAPAPTASTAQPAPDGDRIDPKHVQALDEAQTKVDDAQAKVDLIEAKRAQAKLSADFARHYKIGPNDQLARATDGGFYIKRASETEQPKSAPVAAADKKAKSK